MFSQTTDVLYSFKLDTLFNEEKNAYPVETLVNSPDEDLSGSPNENKWSLIRYISDLQ